MESTSNTKQIGEYLVLDKIGSGTYGTVKLGQHIETKETVALKFIEKPKSDRFEREVGIMQQLKHPHIVQIKDIISIPQKRTACIVMEYCSGGDLFELITKKGRLSEVEASKFLRQMLLALAHCNEHLIIHRDMKPENILLDETHSNIKIADFGFSRYMDPGHFLTSNCGSPLYTAPEIMRGDSYIGPEVDVFSAGVILYAMLSGCIPWAGDTLQEQLSHTIKGEYVPLRKISKSCAHVIDRMLTFDPKKRATVPELLAHPWVGQGTRTRLSAGWLPKTGLPAKVDTEIIDQLVQLKFDREEVLEALGNPTKTYDYAVNLYFLLLEEKRSKKAPLTRDRSDISPNGSDNSQTSAEGESEGEDFAPSSKRGTTNSDGEDPQPKADDVPAAVLDFALGQTAALNLRAVSQRTLLELTANTNFQLKLSEKDPTQLKNLLEAKLKQLGITYKVKHSTGWFQKKHACVFTCQHGPTKFYVELLEIASKDHSKSARVVLPQFKKGNKTHFGFLACELSAISA